ncbi:conserved hypothetical protein [Rhodopseudomonas palustris HaA2]|uniref:Transmembrane protein n=1 Tax=Rhodopseudomonas palustris (strain HaA2) TaxID=316058 RepID=Q2J1S9_RHOP2|nr:hypothetical protein [Rhodopseudomonas palustris]ABD05581.1 conserved hypothetical protein [Rhodopseudomonas palustris HaA2]
MSKCQIPRSAGARALIIATVAALALPALEATPAAAAPKPAGVTTQIEMTDVSAARKRRHVRRGGGNNAAAAAAFAGIIGTIGVIAASQARRDYYESHYYYGPRHYGPRPYGYYGAPGYIGGHPGYGYGNGYHYGY